MSDLKLLDEFLLDYMRSNNLTPTDLWTFTSVTHEIIRRLKTAYDSGEMKVITMTWATHFKEMNNGRDKS